MSAWPLCPMLHRILINCHLFMVIATKVPRINYYFTVPLLWATFPFSFSIGGSSIGKFGVQKKLFFSLSFAVLPLPFLTLFLCSVYKVYISWVFRHKRLLFSECKTAFIESSYYVSQLMFHTKVSRKSQVHGNKGGKNPVTCWHTVRSKCS